MRPACELVSTLPPKVSMTGTNSRWAAVMRTSLFQGLDCDDAEEPFVDRFCPRRLHHESRVCIIPVHDGEFRSQVRRIVLPDTNRVNPEILETQAVNYAITSTSSEKTPKRFSTCHFPL